MKAQLQVTGKIHLKNMLAAIYSVSAKVCKNGVMSNFTAVYVLCSAFCQTERKQKELVWAQSICGGICGRTVKEN